jgi:hypothetical protein
VPHTRAASDSAPPSRRKRIGAVRRHSRTLAQPGAVPSGRRPLMQERRARPQPHRTSPSANSVPLRDSRNAGPDEARAGSRCRRRRVDPARRGALCARSRSGSLAIVGETTKSDDRLRTASERLGRGERDITPAALSIGDAGAASARLPRHCRRVGGPTPRSSEACVDRCHASAHGRGD